MKLLINYFTSKWSWPQAFSIAVKSGDSSAISEFQWMIWNEDGHLIPVKMLNCLIMEMMLIIIFSRKSSSYDWAFIKCYFKHFTCMNFLIFLKNSFGGTYDIWHLFTVNKWRNRGITSSSKKGRYYHPLVSITGQSENEMQ